MNVGVQHAGLREHHEQSRGVHRPPQVSSSVSRNAVGRKNLRPDSYRGISVLAMCKLQMLQYLSEIHGMQILMARRRLVRNKHQ